MGDTPVAEPPSEEYIKNLEDASISVDIDHDESFTISDDYPVAVDTYTWTEDNTHVVADMWARGKRLEDERDYDDTPEGVEGFEEHMQTLRDHPDPDTIEPRVKTRIAFAEPVPTREGKVQKMTLSSTHLKTSHHDFFDDRTYWSESMVLADWVVCRPRDHWSALGEVLHTVAENLQE